MADQRIAHRRALGQVFISHSSVDKRFVRGLERHLRNEGFETWLDEKNMVAGDSLAHEVSKALGSARAVVVVISSSSAASSWVRYELSQAAHRMIEGKCRLVPVLIDDIDPPAELTGLIYADCRPGRRGGRRKLIDALDVEAQRVGEQLATLTSVDATSRGRAIDRIVTSVFDGRGFAAMDLSATRSIDWEVASIKIGTNEVDVVVDDIIDYGRRGVQLSTADWEDWRHRVTEDISETFGLLISERPPDQPLRDQLEDVGSDVYAERLPASLFRSSGMLVLVSLAGETGDEVGTSRIARAREVLAEAIASQAPPMVPLARSSAHGSPPGAPAT